MSKIAVDFVLFPSSEMTEKAIEINQELIKNNPSKIVLDKENTFPHISLCMGCVEQKNLPEITLLLWEISNTFQIFNLVANSLNSWAIKTGEIVSEISIKYSKDLESLHQTIMKKFRKYLSYDVNIPMLYNPQEVEEISMSWVREYAKKYENPALFTPHITIWLGKIDTNFFPFDFSASKIALCQLGNYCTCKKIFASFELK